MLIHIIYKSWSNPSVSSLRSAWKYFITVMRDIVKIKSPANSGLRAIYARNLLILRISPGRISSSKMLTSVRQICWKARSTSIDWESLGQLTHDVIYLAHLEGLAWLTPKLYTVRFCKRRVRETPFIIHTEVGRAVHIIARSYIDSNVNVPLSPEFSVSHNCGTQPNYFDKWLSRFSRG